MQLQRFVSYGSASTFQAFAMRLFLSSLNYQVMGPRGRGGGGRDGDCGRAGRWSRKNQLVDGTVICVQYHSSTRRFCAGLAELISREDTFLFRLARGVKWPSKNKFSLIMSARNFIIKLCLCSISLLDRLHNHLFKIKYKTKKITNSWKKKNLGTRLQLNGGRGARRGAQTTKI